MTSLVMILDEKVSASSRRTEVKSTGRPLHYGKMPDTSTCVLPHVKQT